METFLETRSTRAERRAARRRAHHLVTADEHSLAELEVFLATLPLCASGRIFIEVADASDIGMIEAPGRMTVTWLARAQRSGAPGTGRACAPGRRATGMPPESAYRWARRSPTSRHRRLGCARRYEHFSVR